MTSLPKISNQFFEHVFGKLNNIVAEYTDQAYNMLGDYYTYETSEDLRQLTTREETESGADAQLGLFLIGFSFMLPLCFLLSKFLQPGDDQKDEVFLSLGAENDEENGLGHEEKGIGGQGGSGASGLSGASHQKEAPLKKQMGSWDSHDDALWSHELAPNTVTGGPKTVAMGFVGGENGGRTHTGSQGTANTGTASMSFIGSQGSIFPDKHDSILDIPTGASVGGAGFIASFQTEDMVQDAKSPIGKSAEGRIMAEKLEKHTPTTHLHESRADKNRAAISVARKFMLNPRATIAGVRKSFASIKSFGVVSSAESSGFKRGTPANQKSMQMNAKGQRRGVSRGASVARVSVGPEGKPVVKMKLTKSSSDLLFRQSDSLVGLGGLGLLGSSSPGHGSGLAVIKVKSRSAPLPFRKKNVVDVNNLNRTGILKIGHKSGLVFDVSSNDKVQHKHHHSQQHQDQDQYHHMPDKSGHDQGYGAHVREHGAHHKKKHMKLISFEYDDTHSDNGLEDGHDNEYRLRHEIELRHEEEEESGYEELSECHCHADHGPRISKSSNTSNSDSSSAASASDSSSHDGSGDSSSSKSGGSDSAKEKKTQTKIKKFTKKALSASQDSRETGEEKPTGSILVLGDSGEMRNLVVKNTKYDLSLLEAKGPAAAGLSTGASQGDSLESAKPSSVLRGYHLPSPQIPSSRIIPFHAPELQEGNERPVSAKSVTKVISAQDASITKGVLKKNTSVLATQTYGSLSTIVPQQETIAPKQSPGKKWVKSPAPKIAFKLVGKPGETMGAVPKNGIWIGYSKASTVKEDHIRDIYAKGYAHGKGNALSCSTTFPLAKAGMHHPVEQHSLASKHPHSLPSQEQEAFSSQQPHSLFSQQPHPLASEQRSSEEQSKKPEFPLNEIALQHSNVATVGMISSSQNSIVPNMRTETLDLTSQKKDTILNATMSKPTPHRKSNVTHPTLSGIDKGNIGENYVDMLVLDGAKGRIPVKDPVDKDSVDTLDSGKLETLETTRESVVSHVSTLMGNSLARMEKESQSEAFSRTPPSPATKRSIVTKKPTQDSIVAKKYASDGPAAINEHVASNVVEKDNRNKPDMMFDPLIQSSDQTYGDPVNAIQTIPNMKSADLRAEEDLLSNIELHVEELLGKSTVDAVAGNLSTVDTVDAVSQSEKGNRFHYSVAPTPPSSKTGPAVGLPPLMGLPLAVDHGDDAVSALNSGDTSREISSSYPTCTSPNAEEAQLLKNQVHLLVEEPIEANPHAALQNGSEEVGSQTALKEPFQAGSKAQSQEAGSEQEYPVTTESKPTSSVIEEIKAAHKTDGNARAKSRSRPSLRPPVIRNPIIQVQKHHPQNQNKIHEIPQHLLQRKNPKDEILEHRMKNVGEKSGILSDLCTGDVGGKPNGKTAGISDLFAGAAADTADFIVGKQTGINDLFPDGDDDVGEFQVGAREFVFGAAAQGGRNHLGNTRVGSTHVGSGNSPSNGVARSAVDGIAHPSVGVATSEPDGIVQSSREASGGEGHVKAEGIESGMAMSEVWKGQQQQGGVRGRKQPINLMAHIQFTAHDVTPTGHGVQPTPTQFTPNGFGNQTNYVALRRQRPGQDSGPQASSSRNPYQGVAGVQNNMQNPNLVMQNPTQVAPGVSKFMVGSHIVPVVQPKHEEHLLEKTSTFIRGLLRRNKEEVATDPNNMI